MISRFLGVLAYAVVLGIALMFSVAIFAALTIAALIFWGYFWWKTRALRQQMQERMKDAGFEPPTDSLEGTNIIDGEAVRLEDDRDQRH